MPKIDLSKLRKFKADADSTNAAANESARRYRAALDRVRHAETEAEKFRDGRAEPKSAARTMAERELADARAALRAASDAVDAANGVSEHAGLLWVRCRDFAAAHISLPTDLAN